MKELKDFLSEADNQRKGKKVSRGNNFKRDSGL